MAVDPILVEVFVRYWQATVVLPAMMRELDLKPVEHAARRQAQNPERWRLQHVYGARGELTLDLGATVGTQRADGSPFDVDVVSAENGHLCGIPLGQRALSSTRVALRMFAARSVDCSDA